MKDFSELGLPQPLMRSLERMGFKTPTPIQAEAIPHAMQGRDILGSAQTGTGKTAAFGIPLVANILNKPRGSALVLLPTRELAAQVIETLQVMLGDSRIPTARLIGGEPMGRQFQELKARPRLIVGTPGRINDHLKRGSLMLHDTNFLVLDETDRMLDMGFGIQLDAIAKYLTANRQTLLFSATLPAKIVKLSEKYLTNPVRVSMGSTTAAAENVTQEHVHVQEADKYARLLTELDARQGSIIVFVKTKWNAEKMADRLCKQGVKADALHGDLRQNRRERVIDGFREQKYRVLIATDIASRGLDIPHIQHVINYDLPQCPEDYIHRIGRTARAGAGGAALNLLTSQDGAKWRAIQRLMDPNAKDDVRFERSEGAKGGQNRRRNQGGKPGSWPRKSGGFGGGRSGGYAGSRSDARPEGRNESRDDGRDDGRADTRPDTRSDARPEGRFERRPEGRTEGRNEGRSDTRPQGRPEGRSNDRSYGRPEGRNEGRTEGRPASRFAGRSEGRSDNRFGGRSEGSRNEGRSEGRPQGGRPEYRSERRPEGRTEGRSDTRPQGRVEGRSDARPEGRSNDRPEGRSEYRPKRNSSGFGGTGKSFGKPRGGARSGGGRSHRGFGKPAGKTAAA